MVMAGIWKECCSIADRSGEAGGFLSAHAITTRHSHSLRRLIGNTPLLSLALHILQRAYQTGATAPGDPIAEATSGKS